MMIYDLCCHLEQASEQAADVLRRHEADVTSL